MCVSLQNSYFEILTPRPVCWYEKVGPLGGSALMNGINAFIRETPESSSSPGGHGGWEGGCAWTRRCALHRQPTGQHSGPGLPHPQNVGSKYFVYKPPNLWCFIRAA